MIDERFYKFLGTCSLSEIIKKIGCVLSPQDLDKESLLISGIASLAKAVQGEIAVLNNRRYIDDFKKTRASACIVDDKVSSELNPEVVLLRALDPYRAYQKLLNLFYAPKYSPKAFISPSAYVASSAKIGQNCTLEANVVINEDCQIGEDTIIGAGSVIGFGTIIGKRGRIDSNVSINYAEIGDDAVILSGARIGQDGFGFSTESGRHHKIFHIGKVLIGNDVEIGANTCIDRGSLDDTIIEDFVRIDNLVQIGHNVRVGRGTVIVAQAGVAGSTKLGSYCALGGQSGVTGHVNIGDMAQIAAQSGVIGDLPNKSIVCGMPAVPIHSWRRQQVTLRKICNKSKEGNS